MPDQFTQRDIDGINNPSKWPMYPFLPLKHRTEKVQHHNPLLGLIHADQPLKVYKATNIYTLRFGLDKAETATYDSVEALCEDWVVD